VGSGQRGSRRADPYPRHGGLRRGGRGPGPGNGAGPGRRRGGDRQRRAEALRERGLSSAKARYALALADSQASGAFDIEHLDTTDDATVLATLTSVPEIGVWSAETFLVHNLHRPDVLPAGDLGIRRAIRRQWTLDDLPTAKTVRAQGQAWAPYRTYAAALLWRSLTPPGEPSDPKQRALGT
jgi:DNA-3-methyladenine glycosylase II